MKQNRKSNKRTFIVLGIALSIMAVSVAMIVLRIPVNNISIGRVEHKQSDMWSSEYFYFTGTQTSRLQGADTELNVDVETDKGSLEILLKDTDGNILFSETLSETTSFNLNVPQKIIVSIIGIKHGGGFKISY